ncbi:DNA helicase [Komagataella phaffii CBS 7435]|uniref:ATP-dependent DNA helicase n=2 Tax=Komagataella phaffii TaxID=460519 RepID=C4QYT1_KOMPG|nr:ATP-dependent DNA helicase [Komagataella phaffii GS115]AOA60990.1 GQ67_01597T0 [Komagataella phaffii]CAH2447230.1 DNA helicase [Komagataella phaffii CBS 7435]AOA66826.1 GQ68_01613T0 [Komagataella phaffii GS115]CAY68405.1 ATP-dependent DNA helicase [Komagataella phaffii GS115]CCA37471.1 DNA helicase [Komagataella phaffii CBS 7435]
MPNGVDLDSFLDDLSDGEFEKLLEPEVNRQQITHVDVRREPAQKTLDGAIAVGQNGTTYKEIRHKVTFKKTHHKLCTPNLETYIYPTNLEVREYQFSIVKTALFKNTLVSLPTGLGKTLIASTVMLNFYRWSETAKIIFMAPTRPLVAQQIRACYTITGIPPQDTAILLDKTRRSREEIWDSKRVFFTTPQVVENDLTNGLLNPKDIICLVIDEAHRAKKRYAYNNVAQYIKRFNTSFRLLALTATPSADVEGVQEIVDNLMISSIEIRTDESLDIKKYIKNRTLEKVQCDPNERMTAYTELICEAIAPIYEQCVKYQIFEPMGVAKINAFQAREASQKVQGNPRLPEGTKWMYFFLLQLLITAGESFRRLSVYGVVAFYSYFKEKYDEFTTKWEAKKSKNKHAHSFYYHPAIKQLLREVETQIRQDKIASTHNPDITEGAFSHPKLPVMLEQLRDFFSVKENLLNSKVIIFTEFRESALEIVKVIESDNKRYPQPLFKPHIFIGQAKERNKFDEQEYKAKHSRRKVKKKTAEEKDSNMEEVTGQKGSETVKIDTRNRIESSKLAHLKGMNQKAQKDLIDKFRGDELNILVATSIGEEGLDIGEVDFIICFDTTNSPIKNIQRMGRTGRKRTGKVLILCSNNEEAKFNKAMDNYAWIQKQISDGDVINYHKSDRILPPDLEPRVRKTLIEIPEDTIELRDIEDNEKLLKVATELSKSKKKASSRANSKRQATIMELQLNPKKKSKTFLLPDGVNTGFQKATDLVEKVNSNGEKEKNFLDYSDEDDIDILGMLASSNSKKDKMSFAIDLSEENENTVLASSTQKSLVSGRPRPRSPILISEDDEIFEERPSKPGKESTGTVSGSIPKEFSPQSSSNSNFVGIEDQLRNWPRVDPIFKNKFDSQEGFLTEKETKDLFEKYYTNEQLPAIADDPRLDALTGGHTGRICHSNKMHRYIELVQIMKDKQKSDMLVEHYRVCLTKEEQSKLNDNYLFTDKVIFDDQK